MLYLKLNGDFRAIIKHNNQTTELILPSDKVEVITWEYYSRHHDLVDRYRIAVSQMTTDMFHLS
jgi:hypothetical protein